MSTSTKATNDENKCCAKCGARKSSKTKLLRCSKCLSVKYCSTECQRLDWKRHKKAECSNSSGLPPGASRDALVVSVSDVMASCIRPVFVGEPKNVLCCCWCCGMLLKTCGERGLNPSNDPGGPFWISTFGRIDTMPPVKGKTFPAQWVLGEPGSTGYYVGVNSSGQGAACFYCATFLLHEDGKHAEKHIQKCERYLYDERFRVAKKELFDLSASEKRLLARIILDQEPNLSDGYLSIGGYMNKENKKKKIAVGYNYKSFEHLAFPSLLAEAAEFEGGSEVELHHYTKMRLYSADDSWRNDMDYVTFSILRLAAYGTDQARDFVHQLPRPIRMDKAPSEDQIRIIGLIPGFH